MNKNNSRSPWAWIPSLYFAQGLPYVAVAIISVIMYKRLGVSNTDIALYTSWLTLPWVIKPLWSPFVDLLKTKRWWIVTMQLLIGAGLAGVAFTIPVPFFFQATLAFFWLLAFSSATHDIAADGFYMLALEPSKQALFVGIRSTFFRIATVVAQGLLVIFAGALESSSGLTPLSLDIEASPVYRQQAVVFDSTTTLASASGQLHFYADAATLQIATATIDKDSASALINQAKVLNIAHGFAAEEQGGAQKQVGALSAFWTRCVSTPLGNWIRSTFGEQRAMADDLRVGNVAVATVRLSRALTDDESYILNTVMSSGDKSIAIVQGDRLRFDASNWNRPAYVVFQVDPKLNAASKASYRGLSGNIPYAWSITFFVLAGMFILFGIYHRLFLPRPSADTANASISALNVFNEFGHTFKTFFQKPYVASAIFFMLTFRFSEAQLIKLISPFLLDGKDIGGLGLTTGQVGFVYGTIGIIGLTLGGIIGGIVASRGGLRRWIWPMTLSMLLTSITFVYLAYSQTENMLLINLSIFIEQFGYGFGFTAYMLYLMYFADGEHKTAHYAICTGFMALGMMIPGMFAGWLEELLGYRHFFVWVMICSIVPIIAVSLLKIDPNYGKKQEK